MRPERAPLLSRFLSSLAVDRDLHVWPIFYYVMPYFWFWLSDSVLAYFESTSTFFTSGFLPHFLVGFTPFLCLKGLVYVELLTKLDYCRSLCPFS
jgi:hypothetical protein